MLLNFDSRVLLGMDCENVVRVVQQAVAAGTSQSHAS